MVDCVRVLFNKCVCVFCLGVIVCRRRVWCLFVLLGGVNVFVCFDCELLCAVAWCHVYVVLVRVRFRMCLRVLRVMYCVML